MPCLICCALLRRSSNASISKSIEEQVHKAGDSPAWKVEGRANGQWILMDYVNVVAHIFLKEQRECYGLEELWGDAKIKKIESIEVNCSK